MAPYNIARQGRAAGGAAEPSSVRAWTTVGLLGVLYVLSFIDRTILALLVEPVRADLDLTDVQLGLLFGAIFALFYAFASLPLARLADRYNRKHIIIAGVVFWSICTVSSAFARNFTELALLRFGLAIGEAALTPAALSLIADHFSASRRMLASTLFSLSGMLGSASSYLVGGVLIGLLEEAVRTGALPVWAAWKYVFVAVGLPGILLAGILGVVAREPARDPGTHAATGSSRDLLRYLGSKRRLYLGLFLGAGLGQVVCNAAIAWGPAYLQRDFGYTLSASGYSFGLAQAFGAIAGTFAVAMLFRSLIDRRHWRLAARIPAIGAACGATIIILGLLSRSDVYFLLCYACGSFLLIGVSNSIIIVLQIIVPGRIRATLTALAFICISSLALGVGPPMTAFVADRLGGGLASGLVATGILSLFGALFFMTRIIATLAKELKNADR